MLDEIVITLPVADPRSDTVVFFFLFTFRKMRSASHFYETSRQICPIEDQKQKKVFIAFY